MKKITIKQDPDQPIPVEVLAESIRQIAAGIRKLREGPMKDSALFLLIQHAAPSDAYHKVLTIGQIKRVFQGIDDLEAIYLKPKKADK